MSTSTSMWICGMMILMLVIGIGIGKSMTDIIPTKETAVSGVVGMAQHDDTQGAVLSCSDDGRPVMELALSSNIASYGETVRGVLDGQMILWEQRASGVIGAILSREMTVRLLESFDSIRITIIDWSGKAYEMTLHPRVRDWIGSLPCVDGGSVGVKDIPHSSNPYLPHMARSGIIGTWRIDPPSHG